MIRFALISDVHIKNFKKHKQYNLVFDQIYEVLKQKKPDYILLLGDLFHSKNAIFAEAYYVASNFLRKLSKIAETHVILGNHEVFSKNLDRLDTLTPIIDALNLPSIKFHKYTGQYRLKENIVLHTLSILDKNNWKEPLGNLDTNVALFHGTVEGSVSDSGWVVDKGEINIDLLRKFDYSFCGDIHAHQLLDSKGKMLYVGSTIQNNFGEKDDKGIIIYDIYDKKKFDYERFIFPNPAPFVTVELCGGDLPEDLDIKEGSVVRVVSSENISYDIVSKTLDIIKIKYKPESVVYVSKISSTGGSLIGSVSDSDRQNLRDVNVQEKLIREFLWDYEPSEEVLQKVFELNRKFNVVVEQDETGVARNVSWSLKKVEWSNLFNYGEKNCIDYSTLDGIVGLFGASFKGKSSAIEVILYTIFNAIAKNSRKNYNIINQNCSKGSGRVEITIGNDLYVVERSSEKYIKKSKGVETEEARTTVDFKRINSVTGEEENKNGADRDETDKNIRQVFGTIEDFLLTTISSQFGALSFIDEGETKRKQILAKFLDLDFFEKKFKLMKKESSEIKTLIKKYGELSDFKKRIDDVRKEVTYNKKQIEENKKICEQCEVEKKGIESEISELKNKINFAPKISFKISDIVGKISVLDDKKASLISRKDARVEENKKLSKKLHEIKEFSKDREQNEQSCHELIQKANTYKDMVYSLQVKLNAKNKELDNCNKRIKLLEEVPCGNSFPKCKFIADSFIAQKEVKGVLEECDSLLHEIQRVNAETPSVADACNSQEYLKKCSLSDKEEIVLKQKLLEGKNRISSIENDLLKNNQESEKLQEQKRLYEDNKEIIEDYEGVISLLNLKTEVLEQKEKNIQDCENVSMELYKKHGSMEQQLETLRQNRKELVKIRTEYEAYDLLEKCFHSTGIPFIIIKQQLPYINSEIGKVLASVVGFKVFFESEDDKLNLFIQHKNYSPRPLEMGSGAEKTLASMAIRMGLTKISSLPRCSMLVLDEPVLALDSNILEAFSKLLEVLKEEYKPIVLITHLEALKDIVDNEIILSTKGKFAHINQ